MPKTQLLELYAHGIGIVQDARLEFGPGFNVITGETGAGKTLLLGALELCLGGEGPSGRAS
ncbi:MAG: AAA family ATPase, partial [Acidimicrobiales bacterium]